MEYTMNDYFFGYDQYEDLPATESFVSFNEELFPATEGLKDIGHSILAFIKKVWNGFLAFLKKVKTRIKEFFSRKKENGQDANESKQDKISRLEKENAELKAAFRKANASKREYGSQLNDANRNLNDRNNENAELKRQLHLSEVGSKDRDTKINNLKNTISSKDMSISQLQAKIKQNEETIEKLKKSESNLNYIKDISRNYESALSNVDNAIHFGAVNHIKNAMFQVNKAIQFQSAEEYNEYKDKNKHNDWGIESWMESDNSKPRAYAENAKRDLKETREILEKNGDLGYYDGRILYGHIKNLMKYTDKFTATMNGCKNTIEKMVSMSSSAKSVEVRNKIQHGLNGVQKDWTTLMSLLTETIKVGMSIIKW